MNNNQTSTSDRSIFKCALSAIHTPASEVSWSPGLSVKCLHMDVQAFARDSRQWWSQPGSNRRPPACKAGALPAELWPQCLGRRRLIILVSSTALVGLGGLEPPTSPLSGVRSNHLSYRPKAGAAPQRPLQISAPGGFGHCSHSATGMDRQVTCEGA